MLVRCYYLLRKKKEEEVRVNIKKQQAETHCYSQWWEKNTPMVIQINQSVDGIN